MNARASGWLAAPLLALILTACGLTGPSIPGESTTGSALPVPAGDSPCSGAPLLARDGTEVDLTGEWSSNPQWIIGNEGERTFILQFRDCVWISITDDRFRNDPQQGESYLAQFSGRLSADFSINGILVTVLQHHAGLGGYEQQGAVFPSRLEIEWREEDDGRISLREVPSDLRCVVQAGNQTLFCPDTTILYRFDDEAGSSPGQDP
jgi:hypothetical protein